MPTPLTQYAQPSDLATYGIDPEAIAGMDPDVVEQSLRGATSVVNSALRSRFKLPVYAVDEAVKRATCVLAVYDLLVVRGYNPAAGADDNLRLRVKDTNEWLGRVASGLMTPDVQDSSGEIEPGANGTRASVSSASSRGWSAVGTGFGGSLPGGFVSGGR